MLSPMFVWSRAIAFIMLLAIGVASISVYAAPGGWSVEPKNIRLVDAEQPDETGGLIALYPRAGDAQTLAIPGGEPVDYLHLSLVYLGDDIGGLAEDELQKALRNLAVAHPHPITAHVFGHAIFDLNEGPFDNAVVYLVGDSPDLAPFRQQALKSSEHLVPTPAQHEPWVAHVTASYGPSDAVLTYTGDIVFDRIGLSSGGHTTYFPLGHC